MRNLLQYNKALLLLILFSLSLWSLDKITDSQNERPIVITAQDSADDPYYPYARRPKLSASTVVARLGKDLPKNIRARISTDVNHLPWTLLAPPRIKKEPFKLSDVVVDRIKDPKTGKNYIKLYHGTTADFVDLFGEGAKMIRFDVADRTALGNGFYLTADMNEAKSFACFRRMQRKEDAKDLKGLLLVIGVLDDDRIKGKLATPKSLTEVYSNDEGDPLDKNIYFARNKDSYNQFLSYSNIAPFLKIFYVVELPDGFGKARTFRDHDGLPVTSKEPEVDKLRRCIY